MEYNNHLEKIYHELGGVKYRDKYICIKNFLVDYPCENFIQFEKGNIYYGDVYNLGNSVDILLDEDIDKLVGTYSEMFALKPEPNSKNLTEYFISWSDERKRKIKKLLIDNNGE